MLNFEKDFVEHYLGDPISYPAFNALFAAAVLGLMFAGWALSERGREEARNPA